MGFRKLTARPRHHAQDTDAILAFKTRSRPSASGPGGAPPLDTHRAVVAKRGAVRPEEQHHPAMDQARHPPISPQGSAHHVGEHLWCQLSCRGKERGAGSPPLQHRRSDASPCRNIRCRGTRCPCRADTLMGRLAQLGGHGHPGQYHLAAVASKMPPSQPPRKRLAVHARQLAVEPHLQVLQRHPWSLLLRLEPPHQSAMAHHVHRTAPMGSWVNVSESRYKEGLVLIIVTKERR